MRFGFTARSVTLRLWTSWKDAKRKFSPTGIANSNKLASTDNCAVKKRSLDSIW